MDDGVALAYQVGHAAGRLIERVRARDAVAHVVGHVEHVVRDGVPRLLLEGARDAVLLFLRVLVEVRLPNDVGHARLDDFESVALQVQLDVVIGAGMEVQQVLTDDEHLRLAVRAVVRNLLHHVDGLGKSTFKGAKRLAAQALHQQVERLVEGTIGTARLGLVGAHLAQQLLERIDHRQCEGDFQSRAHVHLEPRMHVVEIDVVVRDDRDLRITGVVERLAKERLVVCEAAVAHVLAGADSDLVGVVLPAAKRGERLADDDLRGEADVVVHVLFSQADGLFAPDFKRDGPQSLALEGDRHQTAERMRGVRDEDHLVLAVGFREFLRIGIGQLAGVLSCSRSGGRGGLHGSRGFRGGLGGRDGGGCWRGCCSGGHRGRGDCSRGRRRGNFPIAHLLVPGLFPS